MATLAIQPAMRWRRAVRVAGLVAFGLTALWVGAVAALTATGRYADTVGVDYLFNVGAAARWLHGGPFYLPFQLAGPYPIAFCTLGMQSCATGPVLYPPVALWLLGPFAYLPAWLWWAVPIMGTGWALWRMRPAPWAWIVILPLVVWPMTMSVWLYGNPAMWIVAGEALGLLYGWPAVLVLVKPTLAPFALVGARRRSWWIALGVFGLACLPFGAMWLDWWRAAVVNPTNGGLLYSLGDVPLLLIPLVAALARLPATGDPAASAAHVA